MRKTNHCKLQVVVLLTFALLQGVFATATDAVWVDIPAGPADGILEHFASQYDLDILYSSRLVEGVMFDRIVGRMTPIQALKTLLGRLGMELYEDPLSGALLVKTQIPKLESGEKHQTTPKMNIPNTELSGNPNGQWKRFVSGLLGIILATSSASAQNADTGLDEDVYELSPFEISTSETVGYLANSTLAGSRINTDLKDIAASITVLTSEFIQDVGAVDLNDLLVYTANTESIHNYTSTGDNGVGDNVSNNPMGQNRVRGMGPADVTRDYFRTLSGGVGFDTYNVEQVTINRGPNSILYGLGNPNGIVNYSTKTANLYTNSNEVSARIGSYGDFRASLDLNRVVIEDKLSIRAMAMASDRGFKQQPAYFYDKRVNLALTYKPFESTTIRAGFEIINQEQNNPNSLTPLDHVSEWVNQGRPSWDAHADDYSTAPSYFTRVQGSDATVAIYNADGTPDHFFMGGNGTSYWSAVIQQRTADVDLFTMIGFSDDDLIPFHDLNLNPNSNDQDLKTFQISLDQKIAEDLYLNVAYINEDLSGEAYGFTRNFEIFVDPNTTYPDGSPNLHFGELFMPQRSLDNRNISGSSNESFRVTLTYKFDFSEKFSDGWMKWLGKHNFTALYERQESSYDKKVYSENREGLISYLPVANRGNGEWQTFRIRYLGGTADGGNIIAPVAPQLVPDGVPYRYWDTTTSSWQSDTYDSWWYLASHTLGSEEVESSAFIWQSYFWEDKIVGTVGWRKDDDIAAAGTYNTVGADGLRIDGNDTTEGEPINGDTVTYGLVVHPLSWLSLHYNNSENFQPAASDVNMYGESIAPPSGTGEDWGFTLQLMDNKINIRTNWYRVEQVNSRMGWSDALWLGQWELLVIDEWLMPDAAAQAGVPYERVTPLPIGDARIKTLADVVAEGLEIEIVANPTDNLRLMLNISQQKAVSSNIAPAVTRFLEEALPYWEGLGGGQVWDGPYQISLWGVEGTPKDWYEYFPEQRTLTYKSAEGRSNPQIREWRMNAIANYTFSDGKLDGWNIGTALRWEDKAAIGFKPVKENGLITGYDLDNPYTDDGRLDIDAWVGYATRIYDKYDLRVQLNVRNLTRSEGFQAINTNSDGTPNAFRIEFGPTWTLESTLSW